MSRLSPPKGCPSRSTPPPPPPPLPPPAAPSELNPQLLPHRVPPPLGLGVHHDPARPLTHEAFFFPLARRVDPHLRAEGEAPARMIQHIDRPHGEAHVALGVDVVQRHPPRLLRILHVHVLVEHDD